MSYLEEVGDQPVVGHLEDGGLGVFVDGHDHLRVLHTGQMLDSTRDTHGDVQVLQITYMCVFEI